MSLRTYIALAAAFIISVSCEKTEEMYEWEGGAPVSSGGGTTIGFTQISSPWSGTLDCIDSRGTANAAIGGTSDNVLASTDTGSTWNIQSGNYWAYVNDVKFVSVAIGWVTNNQGGLFRSMDAGATWTSVPPNTLSGLPLNAVDFYNSNGIAVGQNGQMCRTSNSGFSWTPYGFSNVYNDMHDVLVVGNNAYIVGEAGFIVFTPDLVTSNWYYASAPSGMGTLRKIYFSSGLTGYIVGNNGTVLKTNDAGSSWTLLNFPSAVNLRSVAFQDDDTGVVVGDNGSIYFTRNGGATWGALSSGTNDDINDIVHFADTYVAVGRGGYISKSPNL